MKKFVAMVLGLAVAAAMAIPAFAGEVQTTEELQIPEYAQTDYDRFITEIPADADLETIIKLENRNFKNIQALKPIMEEDSYKAYNKAVNNMKKKETVEAVNAALEARANLIEADSFDDRILMIWDGVEMPCVDGEEFTEEDIDTSQMFGYGFEPFAITYLVEDQSQAKGNIIAVSGGGYMVWSNGSEGYPAAEVFNDLGYNYFLLQRRVAPYSKEDVFMDYNRYVKVVKNYVMEHDLGGQDMYAALGWSGGGGTIMGGSVNYLYGYLNASVYDSDYVPDAIDEISGDVDVELVIYGASMILSQEDNHYLPAFYICVGSEDGNGPVTSTALRDQALELGLPAELYIVEGAPHGFGVGLRPANGAVPGTELWPYQADEFMQANRGFQTNRYYPAEDYVGPSEAAYHIDVPASGESKEAAVEEAEEAESTEAEEPMDTAGAEEEGVDIPEQYTLKKVFDGTYGFGDATITAGTNEEQNIFYLAWEALDEQQVLEGTLEDGIVNVTYDETGFMTGDAQLIWDDAVASAHEWAAR